MFRSQHYQTTMMQSEGAFELTNLRRQNATNKRLPTAEKCYKLGTPETQIGDPRASEYPPIITNALFAYNKE